MNTMKKICATLLFMLTGCGAVPQDYAGMEPKLDLRQYLNGKLEAHGVLIDYTGKADKHFSVAMDAKWHGNTGTLKEHFVYSDGKEQDREWTFTFTDDNNFTAVAADVIGEAVGQQYGNAMNARYTLRATRDNGDQIDLSMDDWMYLVSDKVLINRTKMRKFGITVGELIITFRKP